MEILLVADGPRTAVAVQKVLKDMGYSMLTIWGERLTSSTFDLRFAQLAVIHSQGLMQRCVDRLHWLTRLRPGLPVLVLAASPTHAEVLDMQNAGATEVLIEPVGEAVLRARVQRLARTVISGRANGRLELRIAPQTMEVLHGDRVTRLSPTEMAILLALTRSHGQLVSRDDLAQALPRRPAPSRSNAVDVYVARLRGKLADHYIRTVRAGGYLLEKDVDVSIVTPP